MRARRRPLESARLRNTVARSAGLPSSPRRADAHNSDVPFEQPVHFALGFGRRHRHHPAADQVLRHIHVVSRPAETDER